MGAIIHMDSKKFIKKFMSEQDYKDFQFILIGEDIKTRGEYENVKAIPALMPTPAILSHYINGDKKTYKKEYLNYLKIPNIEAMITIIVKAAVGNDMKMVLMNSKSEDEYDYIKYICEYIEEVFGMETYSYKEFFKNPEKNSVVENAESILKTADKKLERLEKMGVDISSENNEEKYLKQLKKLGRKGMMKFAKEKKIKLKDDLTKDEMAKKILKKLSKQ